MLAELEHKYLENVCIDIEIEEEDVMPIIEKYSSFLIEKYSCYFSRYEKLCNYFYLIDTDIENITIHNIEDIKYLIEGICEAMDNGDKEKEEELYNLLLNSIEKFIKSLKKYGIDLSESFLYSS
jgi:hypothetical protein